jgi:hypothetical protein
VLLVGAGVACGADLLAPSPDALTGHWARAPESMSPSGQFFRMLDFTADGHYVRTGIFRGVYPQLPPDSAASISREYGSYVLAGDTIRFAEDSLRVWDFLSGSYLHVGPPGMYIEGPPTDPVIELTSSRLTLRYMVDPGNGYTPVTEEYHR